MGFYYLTNGDKENLLYNRIIRAMINYADYSDSSVRLFVNYEAINNEDGTTLLVLPKKKSHLYIVKDDSVGK